MKSTETALTGGVSRSTTVEGGVLPIQRWWWNRDGRCYALDISPSLEVHTQE